MTTTSTRELRVTSYAPDEISDAQATSRAVSFFFLGGALALAGWFVLKTLSLPAFNTSMMPRALSAAASFTLIAIGTWCCWLWVRGRKNILIETVVSLVPAGIVLTALGIPLTATNLWLDGIQVDQGFRTQFLSRMALGPSLADMNYVDLPTFYPAGWFWLGGRLANALNMPGWLVYQPWALVSLAAVAAMLTPIWHRLTASLPVAGALALANVAVVLTEVPDEPYAAIVAMLFPAAVVGAHRALSGSWWATGALALYLGVSATMYTLFTALMALTVVVLAVIMFFNRDNSLTPVRHLLVIGFSSMAIALITWGPYLLRLVTGDEEAMSTANHFLPEEGTYFPMPFFSLSAIGFLSLIGLFFLVVRLSEPEVAALGLAILVCYFWAMASMAVTLFGTSLLGFRVEVLLILLFTTAGVLGFAEIRLVGVDFWFSYRFSDATNRAITTAMFLLVAAGSVFYVQQIPVENRDHIDQAYADTDGFGERADRFPADAGRYYGEIVEFMSEHGRRPGEAVIYTDEINFMAFNPYYGFNAFTSHYANPLGEFNRRNEELVQWAELSNTAPAELTAAIDNSQWRGPEGFIFRGNVDKKTPLKTHVAYDIYPSQPNVRYEGLFFNAEAFDSADWAMKQIGPFVVVVRKEQ